MSEELKPCPFCGSPAEMYPDGDDEGHQVMCSSSMSSCHMNTFGHQTVDEAVAAWNTRALTTSQPAQAGEEDTALKELFRTAVDWGRTYGRSYSIDHMAVDDACEHWAKKASASLPTQPAAQATPEPSRPDIIERLSYHQFERDDLTLEECLDYLSSGWKKVHGRTPREMVMQILELLASQPATPTQQAAGEPVGGGWIQPDHLQKARVAPHLCRVAPTRIAPDFVPLSTHPAPAVPDDVQDLIKKAKKLGNGNNPAAYREVLTDIGRAILAAAQAKGGQ